MSSLSSGCQKSKVKVSVGLRSQPDSEGSVPFLSPSSAGSRWSWADLACRHVTPVPLHLHMASSLYVCVCSYKDTLVVNLGPTPKQCDLNLNKLMTSAKLHVHIRSHPDALGRPELEKTLTQYRCKACLEDPTGGVPARQKLIVPRRFLHSFFFLSSSLRVCS